MRDRAAAFDSLAPRYDELWTRSAAGRLQRDAVWRRVDALFAAGDAVLDIGCGTGEDALHLMQRRVTVSAIDGSSEMARIARNRGVDARQVAIEELSRVDGIFNGVLSDFGALNCVADLVPVRRDLARLIRPGGVAALCLLGRFCLWETMWSPLKGEPRKAARRWGGEMRAASLGIRGRYYSMSELKRAFLPDFHLLDWRSIGIFVPPSDGPHFSDSVMRSLGALDNRVAGWPVFRALGDHRLVIFRRAG
jgi:ubiquinone/menaquinone biosynthesis C-methylase UbiE